MTASSDTQPETRTDEGPDDDRAGDDRAGDDRAGDDRAGDDRAGDAAGPGYRDDKQRVLSRLKRIEGQIRGIARMVESDTYCIDVLTQVAAASKALQAVAVDLMDDHLRHCVSSAIESGDPTLADEKLTEATQVIQRLIRSS